MPNNIFVLIVTLYFWVHKNSLFFSSERLAVKSPWVKPTANAVSPATHLAHQVPSQRYKWLRGGPCNSHFSPILRSFPCHMQTTGPDPATIVLWLVLRIMWLDSKKKFPKSGVEIGDFSESKRYFSGPFGPGKTRWSGQCSARAAPSI